MSVNTQLQFQKAMDTVDIRNFDLEEVQRDLLKTSKNPNHRLYHVFKNVEGKRILDVGCYWGIQSRILAERGFQVTGIDIVPEYVDIARKHHRLENLEFMAGDFLDLEFEKEEFDTIIFLETLEHVTNPVAYFLKCHRILKPRGLLLLSTPNNICFYNFFKQLFPKPKLLLKKIEEEPINTGTHLDHILAWDFSTLYRLAFRCGFSLERLEIVGLSLPGIGLLPFRLPVLGRFGRTLFFALRKTHDHLLAPFGIAPVP